jgi:alcohol dehydrogenase class IV
LLHPTQAQGTSFIHEGSPGRVIFGWGARSAIGEELARLGVERAMIVTTPSRADLAAEIARLILGRVGIVYPGAQPNTPTNVTEAALTAASSVKADGLLVIGGGTAIGLSKALSLRTNLPQIAVPTTFAGFENAPFLSETERGARIARHGPSIRPRTTIYDPELVAHLPPPVAGPSAMNAMANALDGLCAPNASPIDALAAAEALRAISAALPRILANSGDNAAWSDALCGAWLAGVGLSAETFHSRLCQTLVDSFGLVHAEVNCLMLPYTAAYRRDAAPGAMGKAASALRAQDAPEALYDLMQLAAARKSLRQMDVTTAELETACDLVGAPGEPPFAGRADILETLIAAYEGRRP